MLSTVKAPSFLVFRGFPQALQAMQGWHIKLDQVRLLSHPFKLNTELKSIQDRAW